MTDGLGLNDAYVAKLERINAQSGDKARLGMAALIWVCHAQHPLPAGELCHALAVGVGSENLNANNISPKGAPLDCCQELIRVDKEASTPVNPSHLSRVFFHLSGPCWRGSFDSRGNLLSLSEFSAGQGPLADLFPNPQSTPFLKCAIIRYKLLGNSHENRVLRI